MFFTELALAASLAAAAGPPLSPGYLNPQFDVLVATVASVDDEGATNGAPPKVALEVEEVLRGERGPGRLDALWSLAPSAADLDCGATVERCRERWSKRPLRGPSPGERWIVLGYPSEPFSVRSSESLPFDAALRARMLRELPARPKLWVLGMLLALPGLSAVSVIAALFARGAPGLRGALLGLALLLPLAGLGLYAWWERMVTHHYDVRVDLLLAYPALAALALSAAVAWRQLRR